MRKYLNVSLWNLEHHHFQPSCICEMNTSLDMRLLPDWLQTSVGKTFFIFDTTGVMISASRRHLMQERKWLFLFSAHNQQNTRKRSSRWPGVNSQWRKFKEATCTEEFLELGTLDASKAWHMKQSITAKSELRFKRKTGHKELSNSSAAKQNTENMSLQRPFQKHVIVSWLYIHCRAAQSSGMMRAEGWGGSEPGSIWKSVAAD